MYFIYMLRCADGTIYTGITSDPVRRMREHLGRGSACAKYTRAHPVASLEVLWKTKTHASAARLEWLLKTLKRPQKLALIEDPSILSSLFSDTLDTESYTVIPGATLEKPI